MKQSWSGDLGPRCAGREDAILVIVSIHLHDSHGVTHGAELLNEHLGETSWSMAPRPHDLQNLWTGCPSNPATSPPVHFPPPFLGVSPRGTPLTGDTHSPWQSAWAPNCFETTEAPGPAPVLLTTTAQAGRSPPYLHLIKMLQRVLVKCLYVDGGQHCRERGAAEAPRSPSWGRGQPQREGCQDPAASLCTGYKGLPHLPSHRWALQRQREGRRAVQSSQVFCRKVEQFKVTQLD